MIVKFYRRFKRCKLSSLIAVSFLVALVLTLSALPGKQRGGRTGQDAYVPFRNLTITEAGAILEWSRQQRKESPKPSMSEHLVSLSEYGEMKYVALVDSTDEHVWLASSVYIFEHLEDSASTSETSSFSHIKYKARSYVVYASNWENYELLYQLEKKELEDELGFKIEQKHVHPELLIKLSFSFKSDLIPIYFLTELLAITVFCTLILLVFRLTANVLYIMPLISLLLTSASVLGIIYSPAFWDADWFYQRLILEDLTLLSSIALTTTFPASAICLLIIPFFLLAKLLMRRYEAPLLLAWSPFLIIIVLPLTILLINVYFEYNAIQKEGCLLLNNLVNGLTNEIQNDILSDPYWLTFPHSEYELSNLIGPAGKTKEHLDRVLGILSKFPVGHIDVLLPFEIEKYIFISSDGTDHYTDVRGLISEHSHYSYYDQVSMMLTQGVDYPGDFFSFIFDDYIEGKLVKNEDGEVKAILIAREFDKSDTYNVMKRRIYCLLGIESIELSCS